MKTWRSLFNICFLAFLVVACAAPGEESAGLPEKRMDTPQEKLMEDQRASANASQTPQTAAERRELRQRLADPQYKKFQERPDMESDQVGSLRGEVPNEMLEKVIDDLVARINADRADVEVIHAEALDYSDGSLGCGKPGQDYTQAIVPGYRIVLAHAGQQFDYRATRKGYFMLCERPTLAAPGAGRTPPVQ